MTTNIPIMKLKSLLTRTPPFHFHSQSPNFIRKAATFKPHNQNPNFIIPIPSLSLVDSCSKSLNLDQKRGMRTESGKSGEIHVIVGPMFAGKTTTLLKRMKLASSEGSSVIVIKSSKDSRYGLDSIVTHDGERLPCFPLAELSSFREKLGAEAYDKVDVIGIDEAQFFGDLYAFCSNAADLDGKTVVVAGLDGDYLRRSFGSVLDIIPIADTVTKLTARCEVCGQKAFFTLRKTDETKTELIAGADVYMPVCRKHYMSGQMVKDVTKTVIESQNVQLTSVL